MSRIPEASNEYTTYQLGGSLPADAPSYVSRSVDRELYDLLHSREFCYVLNSRQMGKSSLRVRLMQQLKAKGVACAALDVTSIGTHQISPQQWYGSLISELVNQFDLHFERRAWWSDRQMLTPVQCFSEFIEEFLLKEITQPLVIFIDEIDSVLQLDFKDDFFALIRACYNKRADRADYQRLTFVLLGVATPADLIGSQHPLSAHKTPFNVGRLVELQGFELPEVQPLSNGLVEKASHPGAVLQAILFWTGGQPFLTQKLCKLVRDGEFFIPEAREAQQVETLVQERIVKNWESQDEPEHLKTIRDRLLQSGKQRTGRLLGLYQQILQHGAITFDASPEQMELRLSGLVVKQENQLRVYNRIYALVFNEKWLNNLLTEIRPYAETFNAWLASNFQDESRLLRGNALQEARDWAKAKNLSNLDYKFLAASDDLDNRTQKEANQILAQARKRAVWISIGAFAALTVSIAISGWILNRARLAEQKVALADVNSSMQSSGASFDSGQKFEALLRGLQSAQKFKKLDKALWNENDLQVQVLTNLLIKVYSVREQNTLKHDSEVLLSAFSPDEQIIATSSGESLKLWRRDGSLLTTLTHSKTDRLSAAAFSPNGQIIATANSDGTVKLWKSDGTLVKNLIGHTNSVGAINFSPDGQIIATGSNDKTVKLWKLDGTLVKTLTGHDYGVRAVAFSPNAQEIASANDNIIKLWTLDGKLLKTFKGPRNSGKGFNLTPDKGLYTEFFSESGISFSPDGQVIATGGLDGTVRLWKQDGKMILLAGHSDIISDFSFSPDSKTIATASRDKTFKLWKLDGTLLQTFTGHSGGVNSVGFSPDGKLLISASGDQTIKLWRLDGLIQDTLTGHYAPVYQASFTKDGKTILSNSEDKTAKLWKWNGIPSVKLIAHDLQAFVAKKNEEFEKSRSPISPFLSPSPEEKKKKKGKINSLSFSSDGKTIATTGEDGKVRLWKMDGTLLKTMFQPDNEKINGHLPKYSFYNSNVSFSPDGTTIASANGSNTVQLWKTDGTLLDTLDVLGSHIIKYSPDGKILATDGSIDPYANDVATLFKQDGTIIITLTGHSDRITDISFSPDGKTIATASADKTVKLWKLDGTLINTLKGYEKEVNSVTFSPDGKTILSSSRDRTIKLWKLDGTLTKSFIGDEITIKNAKFSPDGHMIAALGDQKVKLWTSSGEGLLESSREFGKQPSTLAFSPNSELLAVAYADGIVEIKKVGLNDLVQLGCNWIQDYLTTHPNRQRELTICQDNTFQK